MSKYAEVIVDLSIEHVDKPYTYRIPDELAEIIKAGSPVIVPFGSRKGGIRGYVTAVRDELTDSDISEEKIKDITATADKNVSVEDEFFELASWMKDRYGCTMNLALKTVLPVKKKVKARKGSPVTEKYSGYKLHDPNAAQQKIITKFEEDFDAGIRGTYLLFGVTGSGKTDAYIHMIRHVLSKDRKVVLLIPEISLTYQTVSRLYSVFGKEVAIIHSKLSPGERYEEIRRCMSGEANIIIGPRSAAFAPLKDIGLIVIDEEHDNAYKNENTPRYNTIDIVEKRAAMHGASVILCSATPSPASFDKAVKGEYTLLELKERAAGASLPDIEIVDMREELKNGNRSIFSTRLDELIRDRLDRKEQIILFMNRRGYSNFVSCRSCGNAIRCPHCDVSLTLHRGHKLICHYCGYAEDEPDKCPVCSSPYIAEFGVGTQKLETMASKMYPQAKIARLDTDSASAKTSSERILKDMAEGKTDILIGTQMVVKGHDFPNVTLVGIMAADTSLFVSNYDSSQRTFELITQAAGRSGRAEREGKVVIQTYKPEHYAISNACSGNYDGYYKQEIAFRKMMSYPPAVHIWSVQLSGKDEKQLIDVSERAAKELEKSVEQYGAMMIGPVNTEVYKIQDFFRKMIYVKHTDYDKLLAIKDNFENKFKDIRSEADISIMYDFT